MFEGGIRVPYAVQWPGKIPAGKTYNHPIMSFDITATALAVAGIEVLSKDTIDGKNLIPYLTGSNDNRPHENLFWRSSGQYAARGGDWKLVKSRGEAEMLFDLSKDIGEQTDLAQSNPKKLKELQTIYASWSDQMEKPRSKRNSLFLWPFRWDSALFSPRLLPFTSSLALYSCPRIVAGC
jgi:arylsulfatase A-like enzyme